jgi:hypothetical protein
VEGSRKVVLVVAGMRVGVMLILVRRKAVVALALQA